MATLADCWDELTPHMREYLLENVNWGLDHPIHMGLLPFIDINDLTKPRIWKADKHGVFSAVRAVIREAQRRAELKKHGHPSQSLGSIHEG